MIATLRICEGCGDPLPENAHGNRKWCSERCRKNQYAGTCEQCGAPTDGTTPGRGVPTMCGACSARRLAERAVERGNVHRALIERLWAEGKTAREIGAAVGWTGKFMDSNIGMLRARGYNLPHRNRLSRRRGASVVKDGGMIATLRICEGCGDPLPENAHGNRKWCSERCRKNQYAGTCEQCGAPTDGTTMCGACSARRLAERAVERGNVHRALIERLWAEGKTAREIGAAVGWTGKFMASNIGMLRARGYNLPHRNPGSLAYCRSEEGARHMALARAARRDRAA